MHVEAARFLTSSRGARLCDAARAVHDLPPHHRSRALAGEGTPAEIRLALQQDDLRRRAAARCPSAERLLFTPEALEQATAWPVAEERAGRWPGSSEVPLADLSAGMGLDALAAAATGRPVTAWERDPVRARLLRHNARILGVDTHLDVREGDVLEAAPSGPLAYLDPGRRPGGRRTRDPTRFEPPQATWEDLLGRFDAAMIKLPPSGPAPLEAGVPQEVVSLGGRARERRLFVGRFGALPPRRALSLPDGTYVAGRGIPWPPPRPPREGDWLLDPDPAVTLAGLVGDLARLHGLAPVHPRIAYLLGEEARPGVPGRWIHVEAVLRPRGREVNAWLEARGIGQLTVRTRGVADDASVWRRRLKPRGPRAGTVVFTRGPDGSWIALGATEAPRPRRPGMTGK